MYIEVMHDSDGNILSSYCADTLPVKEGAPLFYVPGGLHGLEQARVCIDTLTAMEIDQACGQKAVIDPVTNEAKIINIDKADYVIENYRINMGEEVIPPPGIIPQGMKMRGLVRKA